MPRKSTRIHPSLLKNNEPDEDDEAAVMQGYPQHGDPAPDEGDFEDDNDEFEDDEDELERPETRAERLEREVTELKAKLARNIPPVEPARVQEEEEEEPDWENLIFTNPGEALRLHGERVRKQVTREITGAYQREKSTDRFWTDFYKANDDLKGDKDIVEMMLSKHMSELADVPVDQAMKKLADLTRQRVMKYSNDRGGKRKRTRAVTTGASNGSRAAAPASSDKKPPASLSAIIKNRREKRRAGGRLNGHVST